MPSNTNKVKFVIHDVDLKVDGNWVEAPDDYIELVQVVAHIQFFKHGEAGIWINLTVGNQSNREVEVHQIEIEMQNSEAEPDMASAGSDHKREFGPDYMWNEVAELEESGKGWTSMFTNYQELSDPTLHINKETEESDRVFYFEIGENDNQHIICTPVTFKENSDDLYDFHTMVSEEKTPNLLPPEQVEEFCPACSGASDECMHRDTTALWVQWDHVDIMREDGQIDFDFEFQIESKVNKIKNIYTYYVLPQGGKFTGSKLDGNEKVKIFQPRNTRWMFAAWRDATEITKTGPENRILRSKVRESEHLYNLGSYQLVERALANEILRGLTLTVIPALLATFLSALLTAFLFSSSSVGLSNLVLSLIIVISLMASLLFYGIYVTMFGRYTLVSESILLVSNFVDYAMKTIGKLKDTIVNRVL